MDADIRASLDALMNAVKNGLIRGVSDDGEIADWVDHAVAGLTALLGKVPQIASESKRKALDGYVSDIHTTLDSLLFEPSNVSSRNNQCEGKDIREGGSYPDLKAEALLYGVPERRSAKREKEA